MHMVALIQQNTALALSTHTMVEIRSLQITTILVKDMGSYPRG